MTEPRHAPESEDATEHHVRALARNLDYLAWSHALVVAAAVDGAERDSGVAEARVVVDRLSAQSGLDPATVRRRVDAVRWLPSHDLSHVADGRLLPIGVVCLVALHPRLEVDGKVALLRELCDLVAADANTPVRAAAARRLQELAPRPTKQDDWLREGDDWSFDSFDARCGRAGTRDRVPGQVYLNLVTRFPSGEMPVVIAMCGSGSGLDACSLLGVTNYVGFDLASDGDVTARHGGRFIVHDATDSDWSPVCAPESAGLVIVTPPSFVFGAAPTIGGPTDLGALKDPEEYLAALEVVLCNAHRALAVDGVLALVVKNTAEFANGTPVPNLVSAATRIIEGLGLEAFLGCPTVAVKRRRTRRPHDGAWLVPHVWHVPIYRKTSP